MGGFQCGAFQDNAFQNNCPPPRQGFGGGPFWRRYGYDRSYEAIREQTTSSALPFTGYDEPVVVARPVLRPKIDYRAINVQVAESVAHDMRRLREEVEQQNEDDLITIFLLLGE